MHVNKEAENKHLGHELRITQVFLERGDVESDLGFGSKIGEVDQFKRSLMCVTCNEEIDHGFHNGPVEYLDKPISYCPF